MFEEIVGASPNFVSWKNKLHAPAPNPNHLYFTDKWPGANWKNNKYFEIEKTAYRFYLDSEILPVDDYKELDLSNATSGLKLYPESEGQVHEILIGFKPGNYIVQIDSPNGSPIGRLPESSMIPSKTDASLKYLNAKSPEVSPAHDPLIKIWAVKDMPAVVLRPFILSGQDYEKATITFTIAIHNVKALPAKPTGAFDTVPFVTEEQWF